MKSLSIEDALQWTQRFAAREWKLLLPVAFAFLALPPMISDLLVKPVDLKAVTAALQAGKPELVLAAMRVTAPVTLIELVIATAGGLAITALALLPAISVREALTLAVRRLGIFIGSLFVVVLAEMFVVLVFGVLLGSLHLTGVGVQAVIVGFLAGVGVYVNIRLLPLAPMIVTRRIGIISALRESWEITQGSFWRILGACLIYIIGSMVVTVALSTGVGAVLALIGKMAGAPDLGAALIAVFQNSVAALVGLGFHLLVAAIFRQINDAPIRGI